jgi:hypothetical protein
MYTRFNKGLRVALLLVIVLINLGLDGTHIAHAAPPSHDDFANARLINQISYEDLNVDTTEATTQPGIDPDNIGPCDNGKFYNEGNKTVWYTYTNNTNPPIAQSISVDTIGSSPPVYDTFISIWKDNGGSLSFVGCNDDGSSGYSEMIFIADPGATYYVLVAEYNGLEGGTVGGNVGGTLQFHAYIRNIEVRIGNSLMGTYLLEGGENMVQKYPVDGGPVEISNIPGAKIIASLNQWRKRPGTIEWTGVSQSMALPVENVSNIYVMPRYDYTSPNRLYNAVLLANVDTVPRDITVTIGGTVMGTYTIGPSQSEYKTYSGVAGGPVVVSSDTGAKIIASIYELRRDPNFTGWNGQSEMMGLPWEGLSDSYVIPIYFGSTQHQNLDARLFIANADTVARDVTVKIGGVEMESFTLQPSSGKVAKYPVDGGPVEIISEPGAKIIASLNQWRKRPGTSQWTGVSQSMALPVDLVSNIYVMPRYDYTSPNRLYNAVLLANVDTVPRDITVTIGGTVMDTYTIGPSQSEYKTYSGVAGGPVVVSSDTGAKIIASIYELRRDPNFSGWNGQSEMMGLPWEELSDSYVIPIYFGSTQHQNLDARLFIAVP